MAKGGDAHYMAAMIDRRLFLGGLSAALVVPRTAQAGTGASAWSRDLRSAARLIGAGTTGHGAALRHLAGLEIRLEEGTKTYWRTPGDSGVPPHFDWSGSTNVAGVEVFWPAPVRFADGDGYSIGYKRDVVLPLAVRPQDAARAVELDLKLAYAVCERMCIPARAEVRLSSLPGPAADPVLVARRQSFAERVPQAASPGLSLSVESIDRTGRHPVVLMVAQVARDDVQADLFVEGPDSNWALPLPAVLDATGATRRFRLELDGVPKGVDTAGQELTCTLVAGDRALETRLRLA